MNYASASVFHDFIRIMKFPEPLVALDIVQGQDLIINQCLIKQSRMCFVIKILDIFLSKKTLVTHLSVLSDLPPL